MGSALSRSEMMRSVKSISKLENDVAGLLWRRGLRFRRNSKKLPGKPDISIRKYKIVIFIDSCFWHNCPTHAVLPKSNVEFWSAKLTANAKRDEKITTYYSDMGWNILRIWEHDLKSDFGGTIDRVYNFVIRCKEESAMKDELIEKVNNLHIALRELNDLWRGMDWSLVPDAVHENYPFREDLREMEAGTKEWLETIKKA